MTPEVWITPPVVVATPTPKPPVKYPSPVIERCLAGTVVPIPTNPLALTPNTVPVAEPIVNNGVLERFSILNIAYGVDVPTPTLGPPEAEPMERIEDEPWAVEVANEKELYELGIVVVADLLNMSVVEAALEVEKIM